MRSSVFPEPAGACTMQERAGSSARSRSAASGTRTASFIALASPHFAEGRLDQVEFDERAGQAMGAKTRADLAGLLDDLPGEPAGLPNAGAPAAQDRPRRRRPRSFLGMVLLVVIIVAAAHAALHVVAPLLWAGLLVAVLIFAARGRPRHDQ